MRSASIGLCTGPSRTTELPDNLTRAPAASSASTIARSPWALLPSSSPIVTVPPATAAAARKNAAADQSPSTRYRVGRSPPGATRQFRILAPVRTRPPNRSRAPRVSSR